VKYLPWVIVAGLVYLLWGSQRLESTMRARIAQLEQRAAQVDTVYVRDTLTLTKVRRVTDSLIVTDTLTFTDTVTRVIMAERRACDAVIQACEQRVAARDAIIKELKKKPSVLKHLPWVVGGFLLHEAID
jgi:hypothetical protein